MSGLGCSTKDGWAMAHTIMSLACNLHGSGWCQRSAFTHGACARTNVVAVRRKRRHIHTGRRRTAERLRCSGCPSAHPATHLSMRGMQSMPTTVACLMARASTSSLFFAGWT